MKKTTLDKIVGGGSKKVLYTLSTLKRIGLLQSAKALNSKNACKACGLGMGGQRGGMTNELDEFPSVCNKSIQAQTTDIQQPIPVELFDRHPIEEFRQLTGHELEHLGRLNTPVYKPADAQHYKPVSWDEAFNLAAQAMRATDPHRSFFYSSGRSSNEAGFVFQLLARMYGTNNTNNCSYYCHQASSVALANTIGTGTSTVELEDLQHCDLIFVIGANPSSNHPRFIHQLQALRERGGAVVIINPAKEPGLVKFAVPKSAKSMLSGGTEIASEYLQPNIGTDLMLLKGLAKAVIDLNASDRDFIRQYSKDFDQFKEDITQTSWADIVAVTGIERTAIERVAKLYSQCSNAVFAWGMGVTHHQHGVDNIEYISNLALLRGMIGKCYAGLLPLRGHSNIQGLGTIGLKPVLPDQVFKRIEQAFNIKLPDTPGMDTLSCLDAAHRGEIDFAMMMGGNLFAASPDRTFTNEALNNIGLKVFLTTTLNLGHVTGMGSSASLILPVTARDEEWQPTTQESMFNYVRLSDGGIDRLTNVRPETDVLTRIAEKVMPDAGLDFAAFRDHKQTRAAIASTIPGMEMLTDIDASKIEFHIPGRLLHQPSFNTPDNRASFITRQSPKHLPSESLNYKLMTVRSEGQFNTIIYEEQDTYRNTDDRWSLLLSVSDIEQLGIEEGDRVTLRSNAGEMKHLKVFPFDLPAGNAMAYFPEANILVGREHDPRSLTPAFKSVDVQIEVEPGAGK
jgi:molybdopterin-dependent oxidoreductase alpha subunit